MAERYQPLFLVKLRNDVLPIANLPGQQVAAQRRLQLPLNRSLERASRHKQDHNL